MNKKLLLPIVIVVILVVIIGIYFATRGVKGPEERTEITNQTQEEVASIEEEATLEDCIRGIEAVPISQRDPFAYFTCAAAYKNPQVCEEMKLPTDTLDPEASKQARDACYMNYAGSTKDISACDKINLEEAKRSCRALVESMP